MKNEDQQSSVQVSVQSLGEKRSIIKPYDKTAVNYTDIIPFGSDNLFPQSLALFARQSPNHRGIINSKHQYFIGDGITSEDSEAEDMIQVVNFEGESLTGVVDKLMLDDIMIGNPYIELITNDEQTFLWFNHIDATKARLTKDAKGVILHSNWKKDTGKTDKLRTELPLYPNWKRDKEKGVSVKRCVFHFKRYEPEFTFYGIPQYIAATDSIEIDLRTNRWNLARLQNSFRISGMLIVPVKDKAESDQVIDYIEKNHIGDGKQSKLLTLTKSRARENEKADRTEFIQTATKDEGDWTKLHEQAISDMIVAHSWFRSLTSLPDNTGFDTQRILNEYEIALKTVITSTQKRYTDTLQKLYKAVISKDVPLMFKNSAPVDDDKYYYIWELRKSKGLDYNENDPEQKILIT